MAVGSLTESLADGVDVKSKIPFFDERVRPDRLEQVLLADDIAATVQEGKQEVGGLRGQRNELSLTRQPPIPHIETERPELQKPQVA
jgi:hypothetical protein